MVTTTQNLSPNCYSGHTEAVSLIGIHTMEAPEEHTTAEEVANYFGNPAVQASAHWCVDDNSRVRVVRDENSAWTMPPTNHYSLNVEMAGYAGQTDVQWDDAYSLATMDNAALCVAEWCKKYNIPVRHLTHAQIAAREKGIAGHIDVNDVYHASTHWDPGPNFPWTHFLSRVYAHLGSFPPPSPGKPDCVMFQKAVRVTADNQWGRATDKHAAALIAATNFGGNRFPYGIDFAQKVVGTKIDGLWGVVSKACLKSTVAHVQNALTSMSFRPGTADGLWGDKTNEAYLAARKACHI